MSLTQLSDELVESYSLILDNPPKRNYLKQWTWNAATIIIPVLTGLVIVMSTTGNGALAYTVGSIFWAVCFTYTVAATLCVTWAVSTGQESVLVVSKKVIEWLNSQPILSPKWLALCGGFCGASQNLIGAIVTKRMGSAVYSLSTLLGCVVTSSLIDHFGLAWTVNRKMTWPSILGILILAGGCILYRVGAFISEEEDVEPLWLPYRNVEGKEEQMSLGWQALYVCLAIFSGFTAAFQGPLGSQLGRIVGQFRWAAAWSFSSGLVPCLIIAFSAKGLPEWNGIDWKQRWFGILPGGLVICSLFVTAWFPRYVPVSTVWSLVISGQILSSAVLDSQGWAGLEQRGLDWYNVGGLIVVLLGIIVIAAMKSRAVKSAAKSFQEV